MANEEGDMQGIYSVDLPPELDMEQQDEFPTDLVHTIQHGDLHDVMLPQIPLVLKRKNCTLLFTTALLDTGSSMTICTKELYRNLGVQSDTALVTTVGTLTSVERKVGM